MTDRARKAKNAAQRKWAAGLSPQAKEARRAYKREWQKNHPEKVRLYLERYWEKKAAESAQE